MDTFIEVSLDNLRKAQKNYERAVEIGNEIVERLKNQTTEVKSWFFFTKTVTVWDLFRYYHDKAGFSYKGLEDAYGKRTARFIFIACFWRKPKFGKYAEKGEKVYLARHEYENLLELLQLEVD